MRKGKDLIQRAACIVLSVMLSLGSAPGALTAFADENVTETAGAEAETGTAEMESANAEATGAEASDAVETAETAAGAETGAENVTAEDAPDPYAGIANLVRISTAEEMAELSANSSFDTYTKGKYFLLTSDIDLSGSDFAPVASFGGTFDGNGHTIKGFRYTAAETDVGLFKFVEQGATVKNLNVIVSIELDGTKTRAGGIAGTNRGTISGCTVTGKIKGNEDIGGIAGKNEASGLIEDCTNKAKVLGFTDTGGIAGANSGIIETSVNDGEINTEIITDDSDDSEETSEIEISDDVITLERDLIDAEQTYHTGGIAGKSDGTISGCTNNGSVGYMHSGYNTGGIAGIHDGYTEKCVNNGVVSGRRDVGGIVGQHEPYLALNFKQDHVQETQNRIDELLDQFDSLLSVADSVSETTRTDEEALRATLKTLRSSLQEEKHYYYDNSVGFLKDLDNYFDALDEDMEDFELLPKSSATRSSVAGVTAAMQKVKEEREALNEAIANGSITSIQEALELLTSDSGALSTLSSVLSALPSTASSDINSYESQLRSQKYKLIDDIDNIQELLDTNMDDLEADLDVSDDKLTKEADDAVDSAEAFLDNIKSSRDAIDAQTDIINDTINEINRVANEGIDTAYSDADDAYDDVKEAVTDDESSDRSRFFDDVSESDISAGSGAILYCENNGVISGDSDVGGVAGIIGIELSEEREVDDIDKIGDVSLSYERTMRAVISGCVNREEIFSTNDYAGGIAGRADVGSVTNSSNFGDVSCDDGDYAGGIAGSSENVVSGCYSLCTVGGEKYVGGICGYGDKVKNSLAMAGISGDSGGEYHGAVAGYVETEASGNVFVWEGLPAINGVSYESEARGISYEEAMALSELPDEFRSFRIRFYVGDELYGEVVKNYGESLSADEMPAIPEKSNHYSYWEEKDTSFINRNLKIHAVYELWDTCIASGAGDGEKPYLLMVGEFHPESRLDYSLPEESSASGMGLPQGYELIRAFDYTAECSAPDNEKCTQLRIYDGDQKNTGRMRLAVLDEDGRAEFVKTSTDGSYLVYDTDALSGKLALVEAPIDKRTKYMLIGAAALIAVIFLSIIVRDFLKKRADKKKRKADSVQENEEKQEPGQEQ